MFSVVQKIEIDFTTSISRNMVRRLVISHITWHSHEMHDIFMSIIQLPFYSYTSDNEDGDRDGHRNT
jgi:hypothetical protein